MWDGIINLLALSTSCFQTQFSFSQKTLTNSSTLTSWLLQFPLILQATKIKGVCGLTYYIFHTEAKQIQLNFLALTITDKVAQQSACFARVTEASRIVLLSENKIESITKGQHFRNQCSGDTFEGQTLKLDRARERQPAQSQRVERTVQNIHHTRYYTWSLGSPVFTDKRGGAQTLTYILWGVHRYINRGKSTLSSTSP